MSSARGGKYGFIGIGARPAVISGHGVLSSLMYYNVQAGPVLVLHVASIMGTVVQLLTGLHTRCTQPQTHIHTTSHAPLHTNAAFRMKAKAKKKMNAANSHPSGLQNNNRGDTELIRIKTCNICNPSEYTDNQQSLAALQPPSLCSWASQQVCLAVVLSIGPILGFSGRFSPHVLV